MADPSRDGFPTRLDGAAVMIVADRALGAPARRGRTRPSRFSLRPLQCAAATWELLGAAGFGAALVVVLAGTIDGVQLGLIAAVPLVSATCIVGGRMRSTLVADRRGIVYRRGRHRERVIWADVQAVVTSERVGRFQIGITCADGRTLVASPGPVGLLGRWLRMRIASCAPEHQPVPMLEHRGPWGSLRREQLQRQTDAGAPEDENGAPTHATGLHPLPARAIGRAALRG